MTDNFQLANEAFELMTLSERREALEAFARLRYASIEERFFEAVYLVTLKSVGDRRGLSGASDHE